MSYRTIMDENGVLRKVVPGEPQADTHQPPDLGMLSDEDIKRECKETLVMIMRQRPITANALAACRELYDRIEGKPIQRAIVADAGTPPAMKHLNARNEQIDRILKASRQIGIIP